jgi:LytS/YehU family sensor histidine kinase
MRLTLEYSKGTLIPIDKEIESLQNYLELEQLRFHNKFTFSITSSDKIEFNMGLPPLLVQPFVENAILHGIVPKDSDGSIEVAFDVSDEQLICSITDDGIGLEESKLLKENSVMAHKSMALEITKKRLEIMESTTLKSAQIDIIPLENKSGTRVILRLPIQYIQ